MWVWMFVAYLSVVAAGDVLHEALVVEEIVAVRGKWMSKRDAPEVPLRDPNPLIADDMSISKLDGTCWSYQSGGTSYKFCPFRNITQTPSYHRSAVLTLGLWDKWASNRTMLYTDGCKSGCSENRLATVFLACPTEEPYVTKVVSVDEVKPCRYQIHFQTKYACELPLDKEVCNSKFVENCETLKTDFQLVLAVLSELLFDIFLPSIVDHFLLDNNMTLF